MTEQYLAYALLLVVYIFGGAAFFDCAATRYKDVLFGWSALNAFVVVVCGLVYGVMWSLSIVFS